jgi:hypothetical protein
MGVFSDIFGGRSAAREIRKESMAKGSFTFDVPWFTGVKSSNV